MSVFDVSSFVWVDGLAPSRNQFVSFERRINIATPKECQLHLFADTRFRLWVNGQFVAYGPARFVTQHPEYDSYELSPYLQAGDNLIRVEVNYYGASSFQSMPDGMPGFIAAGGTADGAISLATPGDWQARVHEAWNKDAPLFSFAQNPAEICDTKVLEKELSDDSLLQPLRELNGEDQPWNLPTPRTVLYPDYQSYEPSFVQLAAPLEVTTTYGFQTVLDYAIKNKLEGKPIRHFATWLHSDTAQQAKIGCFWSDLTLNGKPVEVNTDTMLGNHGEATLSLQAGWNLLSGTLEILTQAWSYLVRLPESANLRMHALPDTDCKAVFSLSPILAPKTPMPKLSTDAESYSLPEGWSLDAGDSKAVTPARMVAWDCPDSAKCNRDVSYEQLHKVSEIEATAATWVFRFDRQYHGQPMIEVEAPAGTIMDVAYDDWKREDGCANIYGSNHLTDAADRFILKGGKQCVDAYHPRGGNYLQITLRSPDQANAVKLKLHSVALRRRTLINEENIEGSIATQDPTFDYTWQASLNTLCAATDEAYTDCPWRERGSYIGDALVSANLHRLVSDDLSIARRTFRNYGLAALPDGQLACCAPSWLRTPLADFTQLWIMGVYDLWSMTGDSTIIEENWGALEGIWTAPWDTHESGLWNADNRRLFTDWGVNKNDRTGQANALINILRIASLRASADMAETIGKKEQAATFRTQSEQVNAALVDLLWLESEGRFRASLGSEDPALHANILALHFGIGDQQQLLNYLKPKLDGNFKQGIEKGLWSGHAELYFLYFVLPTLGALNEIELAEKMISEHYGFLQELHFNTLVEHFATAKRKVGSGCHTWAGAGAIYAHRYILGLRQVEPGNPDLWLLEPHATQHFQDVSGTLPHTAGAIKVSWQRKNDAIEATVSAPEGVTVQLGKGVVAKV